jgi:Yip1-like protein
MEATNPAPGAATEVSAGARIPGVFFSPVPTFESIARRPTWLFPLILWTLLSLVVAAVLMPRIDYEALTRQAMQRRGQTVPEERISTIVEQQKKIGSIFGWVGGGAAPAVISVIVAVVIWGAFKAFGWDARFSQAFGVTTHAFLPGVLKSVLLLFLIRRQETVNPQALGDLLKSNLGFLADDSSKGLHAFLASLDIFALWTLALLVIGFAASARIKRGSAAGVIGVLWLLTVAIRVGWNMLF